MGIVASFYTQGNQGRERIKKPAHSHSRGGGELGSDSGSLTPEPQPLASRPIQKRRDDCTIFSFLFSTVFNVKGWHMQGLSEDHRMKTLNTWVAQTPHLLPQWLLLRQGRNWLEGALNSLRN